MALESLGLTKEKFAEFLEPLFESCLPENVLRAWERSRSVEGSSPQDSARSLDKLLCFLRNEVQNKESAKSNDENTVVSSSVLSNQSVNETVYLQTLVFKNRTQCNLDAIGITDPTEDAKRKHAHFDFLNQFKENLSVLPDGRYKLPIPFKFETQLPNNKSATFKRHQRMCQRIDEQNLLNEYECSRNSIAGASTRC
ncbi:integrase catalytic domain-containing protein [Trichonephila clavipes]|nr:integrase catalytic domain-containing protein [Trichonephila clavipes]